MPSYSERKQMMTDIIDKMIDIPGIRNTDIYYEVIKRLGIGSKSVDQYLRLLVDKDKIKIHNGLIEKV